MTWGFANWLHICKGHESFITEALAWCKSEMFIRNVCNNQNCTE